MTIRHVGTKRRAGRHSHIGGRKYAVKWSSGGMISRIGSRGRMNKIISGRGIRGMDLGDWDRRRKEG